MNESHKAAFNPADFLAVAGLGRKIVRIKANESFFIQGAVAGPVFYLQAGHAKLTVISKRGKEATIALLKAGDFIGEEAIAGVVGLRISTATAITSCTAMKIERTAMVRVLHDEATFSQIFLKFIPCGVSKRRKTLLTNCSIRVKRDWHENFFSWRSLVSWENLRCLFQQLPRKRSLT